jgi:hypothetical protein
MHTYTHIHVYTQSHIHRNREEEEEEGGGGGGGQREEKENLPRIHREDLLGGQLDQVANLREIQVEHFHQVQLALCHQILVQPGRRRISNTV